MLFLWGVTKVLGESLQSWQERWIDYPHRGTLLIFSKQTRSPLVYLLQSVPTESCPVLEDVIERVQCAQLPPLLLMINSWRSQSGMCWGGEGGRGGWKILLLLRVPGILAPALFCCYHLPSSTFLLADLPGHATQLLQATSPLPLPLTSWIWSAAHP